MQDQAKGFLKSLFDISFTSLITTKIIKVIYVFTLIIIGFMYIAFVMVAFDQDSGAGAFVLFILGPLFSLFWIIVTRVWLEFMIAVFRIVETNVEIAANTGAQAPPRGQPLTPGQPPPSGQPLTPGQDPPPGQAPSPGGALPPQ